MLGEKTAALDADDPVFRPVEDEGRQRERGSAFMELKQAFLSDRRAVQSRGDFRRGRLTIPVSAILVAVLVLDADFHPARRPTFIVRTAVTISI